MITDIFSSFDPYIYNFLIPSNTLTIIIRLTFILVITPVLWLSSSRHIAVHKILYNLIFSQLARTQSVQIKGIATIITTIFTIIIFINLIGLLPYILRASRHLIFTLTIGLPIWLRIVISRFIKNLKASVAHLLPDGAPDWLNPFLVLIETSRITVRPLTLSFRLAANMRAGHIVLGLVGIYGASSVLTIRSRIIILLPVSIGYIIFEIAICIIQAYIFCLLLSLYSDDHAH